MNNALMESIRLGAYSQLRRYEMQLEHKFTPETLDVIELEYRRQPEFKKAFKFSDPTTMTIDRYYAGLEAYIIKRN